MPVVADCENVRAGVEALARPASREPQADLQGADGDLWTGMEQVRPLVLWVPAHRAAPGAEISLAGQRGGGRSGAQVRGRAPGGDGPAGQALWLRCEPSMACLRRLRQQPWRRPGVRQRGGIVVGATPACTNCSSRCVGSGA